MMENLKNKLNNTKDKAMGEVKDQLGKMTGNESLELKGKIQSIKSDMSEMINTDRLMNKADDVKEGIARQINNFIDQEDN